METRGAVTVRMPPGARRQGEFVLAFAPRILEDVSRSLGVPAPGSLSVALLRSGEFRGAVGERTGRWAVAAAFGGRNAIVISLGRLDPRNDLATTLCHEIVHLVLGRAEVSAGRRLPRWFHEGVAQKACTRLFAGTRDAFLVAARAGRLPPLDALDDDFPDGGAAVDVAYAQALDFVTFLERTRPGAQAAVLQRFASGLDFPDAVALALGEDLDSLEARWRADLAAGPPFLVSWLQNNPSALWILLFAFAAFATVAGALRARRRRAELFRRWEDEEGIG